MASKIGIKLADGTFFPILDEDALSEQSLELTTVRDNQESVQINLFKKFEEEDPEYIGSLIVEEVSAGSAGDPTINLKIKLDEEKNLSAEALDEGSGSHQSLKVSLKNLDEASLDGIDFDFASFDESFDEDTGDDFFAKDNDESSIDDVFETQSQADSQLYGNNEEKNEKKKKMPLWLIVLIIILCITALVFAILLLTKKMPFADKDMIASAPEKVEKMQESKKDVNATTSTVPKEDAAEKAAAEAKRKAEEEERQKAEAKKKAEDEARQKAEAKKKTDEEAKQKAEAKKKAESQKKTTVNSQGVVRYKIKWGDTLWDLSETFYKTPWLYKKIADYNKIKNPSLIIAGTYIDIPPK
ncbi:MULTISPECIES: LysM peptidoglycan-binding domain-containing protein [unclassified Treponema]|uniref:LysM peptidoglycan-binding domain-containing protein n=1 Tax=unclassified Treponema TaxID=2638727 RepID=UPI0020A4A1B1|nr:MULTISPECIES: LysM peptidoglycan-binding domain-containing protein [unclassified Treponema]UTC66058.1 LysM peptidoglycan-binding domain-containing protein [Treponema sp. OMZ 789]UTC68788.1 LysM peptidoglycan-binding domain-containing protein [Treponema sp. OMZ 790]UTC71517.1 LysM peptidoglycan-binding domain-containing protein [Treponema sp. OMZ 791]